MRNDKKQVFVSYHSDDLEFVQDLARRLRAKLPDTDVVYDRILPPGESFADTLISGINTSQTILAVLSPSYLTSAWAKQELNVAIECSLSSDTTLIPVLLRPCNPSGYITLLNSIDFTQNKDEALRDLIWGITGDRPLAATGQDPGRPTNNIDPGELEAVRSENRRFTSKSVQGDEAIGKSPQPEQNPRCFVIMPFNSTDLQWVYEDIVKPAATKLGVCERGDDAFGSNVIMEDILNKIKGSSLIVADLTGKNANVFYELGICHALDKPVLLLAQTVEDIPFDLRHRRVLLYEYSPPGCSRLKGEIGRHLQYLLTRSLST